MCDRARRRLARLHTMATMCTSSHFLHAFPKYMHARFPEWFETPLPAIRKADERVVIDIPFVGFVCLCLLKSSLRTPRPVDTGFEW